MSTDKDLIKVDTMTSLEISQLTGKQHKNVLVDIKNLTDNIPDLAAGMSAAKYEGQGKAYNSFNLSRDFVENLVMGYSPQLRYKVQQRLKELEAKSAPSYQMMLMIQDCIKSMDTLTSKVAELSKIGV